VERRAVGNGRQLVTDPRATRAGWDDRITARRDSGTWKIADLAPDSRPITFADAHRSVLASATIVGGAATGGAAIAMFMRELAARIDVGKFASLHQLIKIGAMAIPLVWVVPFVAVVAADTSAGGGYQPVWDGGLAFVSVSLMLVLLVVASVIRRASRLIGRSLELNAQRVR
jgi:hypothetical protein